eukprot:Transcript_32616.p1 GENE.Transcript_32616~~Transcript_32616.p1  ORF type:complete len:441 (-),score=132.44 Transcript_32616:63-1235(-)
MLQPNPTIGVGDLVIIYEDFKTSKAVYVAAGSVYRNKFGSFPHDKMVGRRFGDKMSSHNGHGFVHLLPPTPELWTASLTHRTQILYIADISMICLQLELLPGARVIEAGTGSGSLSHALARSVGPSGHLFTFEFNEARAQAAAGEFAANKLAHVTCRHADVCAEGWAYPGIEPGSVDAVIFDLPQPWDAVARVAPFVRPGGRLCCFSPCIEQVARAVEVLPALGFTRVEVLETLVKTHEVKAVPQHDPIAAIVAQAEAPAAPPAPPAAAPAAAPGPSAAHTSAAQGGEPAEAEAAAAGPSSAAAEDGGGGGGGEAAAAAQPAAEPATAADAVSEPPSKRQRREPDAARQNGKAADPPSGPPRLQTKPYDDLRGHTGFLLFCSKHVSSLQG